MSSTPRQDGLTMPIRWVEHERTLISWPARESMGHFDESKREWARVARLIAEFEPVSVIANPGTRDEVLELCGEVDVIEIALDDAWIRDNGPIFLTDGNGGLAMTNFGFNAWGEKFTPWDKDAAAGAALADHLGIRRYVAPIIAEGGGLACDGEGTVITTESVVMNPNRNPGMSREELTQVLCDYLGVQKVIWLPYGLAEDMGPDGTDGHSDNIIQFIKPGQVLFQEAPDRSSPNWDMAAANRAVLERETDAHGRKLEIVEMPVLPFTREIDGVRYAAPYTNFYPVNGGIIAPVLDTPEDEVGHAILRELFPDRKVVGAPTDIQACLGGGIGCITQQIPVGTYLM